MNSVVVKVAPNGEGKTAWLVEIAKTELENSRNVVFFSSIDATKYVKFAEQYHVKYNVPCPVTFANRIDLIEDGSVVLIDNLFKQDLNTKMLSSLFSRGCCIYLTVCGLAA